MRTANNKTISDAVEQALPALGDRLTLTEAAQAANCSARYLQKMAKVGKGPPRLKWAGRVYYSRSALVEFFGALETRP